MKVLAVTGGIGSGKSFLIMLFNALGIPSYDSDRRVKELYDEEPELLAKVAGIAGGDVLADGKLDRRALAGKIFASPVMLSQIEAAVHPAVIADFERWKSLQSCEAGFVIFESAIILEKPAVRAIADKVLVVTAPLETRIERVMLRDRCSREQVLARLANQCDDRQRLCMADFVIFADDSTARLPQVLDVIDFFRKESVKRQ